MRSKFSRILAGLLAFVMVLFHTGAAVPAYAAKEQAQTSPSATQGTVLTATQSMVDSTGILTISGEWDRIVVPKEITAISIFFQDVQADVIEIESGLTCRIVLVSGSIGEVAIIPAKITQLNVQTLIQMFKGAEDPQTVIDEYNATKAQNDIYLSNRPTLVTQDDVTVANMSVSGNVKLNLADGDVSNISIHADGSQIDLDVDISHYNGSLSVSQTNREDEKWMIARVTLKDSTIETLATDGDGHGNIILDGKNSSVEEFTIDRSAMVSLDVPTSKVDIPENASQVNLTVLDKVDDMNVSGNGSSVAVGNCGTVTNATVEGNDVTISGNGTLTDVKIIGSGVAVSTPNTNVEGENTYVPPVIATPDTPTPPSGAEPGARDLHGLELVIADDFSYGYISETDAQRAYRKEMMQKHNFTVKHVTPDGYLEDVFATASALGTPTAHIYLLNALDLGDKGHLFYNLSTLSELDFNDDKWDTSVKELMTYKNGIYGMTSTTDVATYGVRTHGVIYNKRLFEAAGLDPELPYTLQANGEWTWSRFMELCAQLTRDVDDDGIDDYIAMYNAPEELMSQLVISTGSQLIEDRNGVFVSNLASDDVVSAITYAKELYDAGYDMNNQQNRMDPCEVFTTGLVAMQFNAYDEIFYSYENMAEDLGFVCCPKPDDAASYQILANPCYVAVIPSFYDAKTASDIAFAYNLWTNPVPEGEETGDSWKSVYESGMWNEQAVNETLSLYYEEDLGTIWNSRLTSVWEEGTYSNYIHWALIDGRTPTEALQTVAFEYNAAVASVNTARTPNVTVNPTPYTLPYTLELNPDGTLTILGCTNQNITEVVIPNNINGKLVTAIGYQAFGDFYSLTSVTLPNTLQTIDNYAFGWCPLLDNIVIPEGVTIIGQSAFSDCSSLKSITLPSTLEILGQSAFSWCTMLENVVIPKGITTIPYSAFEYCSSLENITLPDSVTQINGMAFAGCSMLDNVVIPEGVTTIEWNTFANCTSLKNITIPSSVTEISYSAFDGCSDELTFIVAENSYAEQYALEHNYNVKYTTPVRDLGGMNIVVGDWYSNNWTDDWPYNEEMEALQTYRNAMMKKYNFTITQKAVSDWGTIREDFNSAVESGNPEAQVYLLHNEALLGNIDLFYDLSTLSELNFNEDKWYDTITEFMSYRGGIYGMLPTTGINAWEEDSNYSSAYGVVFNKRLLAEAGIDPDLPYDLQASDQWTWSAFEELCAQLTRDTDGDGITDVYASANSSTDYIKQLIFSTGEQLIEMDANGNFVNNTDSQKIRDALEYAVELYNAGYIRPQGEDEYWDYFISAFRDRQVAMLFTGAYTADNAGGYFSEMEDELGFVCCPKPDYADSYQFMVSNPVAVIPACYDAKTAADIAFAYSLWVNPAPGYEADTYQKSTFDDRAINETFALYENSLGVVDYTALLIDSSSVGQDLYYLFPFNILGYSLDECLDTINAKWDDIIADANN